MPTLAIGSPPEPDNRDEHPTVPGAYEREAGTGPSALEADTRQLKPALAAIEAAVEDVGCRHPEPLVGSYADGVRLRPRNRVLGRRRTDSGVNPDCLPGLSTIT